MDNNNLLMIILAFVFGYCLQGMMKNMCGGQIIEYSKPKPIICSNDSDCQNTDASGAYQKCTTTNDEGVIIHSGQGTCVNR